jgi:nucleotide-binding universal stress UspA family protein
MLGKILLATDGSVSSRKALEFSVEMAARYEAQLYVLHVISSMQIPVEILEYVSAEDIEDSPTSVYLEKIGLKIVHQSEKECKATGCENVHTVVLRGDPADTIIEFAKEESFDVIILGSRGFRGIKGKLLGSVSRKVSHAADCTCIIVK